MRPLPSLLNRKKAFKYSTPKAQERIALIMELLKKPHTIPQLAKALGINDGNARNYVLYLYGQGDGPKRIHVWGWYKARPPIRMTNVRRWKIGNFPDRAEPRKRTLAEQSRLDRERRRKDPERVAIEREKQKIRDMRRPSRYKPPPPDPLVALFFGMAA